MRCLYHARSPGRNRLEFLECCMNPLRFLQNKLGESLDSPPFSLCVRQEIYIMRIYLDSCNFFRRIFARMDSRQISNPKKASNLQKQIYGYGIVYNIQSIGNIVLSLTWHLLQESSSMQCSGVYLTVTVRQTAPMTLAPKVKDACGDTQ